MWGNLGCQVSAILLTVAFREQWQASLARDPLGSHSPYPTKILATHWIRTLLTSGYAIIILAWVLAVT